MENYCTTHKSGVTVVADKCAHAQLGTNQLYFSKGGFTACLFMTNAETAELGRYLIQLAEEENA